MGLRLDKQERQRAEIIENAIALFREGGFEAVKVREIAARARVSEATFFNYFGSKDGVLCEWGRSQIEAAFEAAAAGGGPLRRDVRRLARAIAARVGDDEPMMREAWCRARIADFASPARGRAAPPAAAKQLMDAAAARGEVRGDVPTEHLAELLRCALEASLTHWLERTSGPGDHPPEPLDERLLRTADLLLDAYRKRNERVRPALPAARPTQPHAAR